MVVPLVNCDIKTSSKNSNNSKIVANGKHISIQSNSASLQIIGNGNSVDIERNDGDIKILGDGCLISITAGSGTLKYVGDGGIICAGTMNIDKIQYKGDGGVINGFSKSPNTKKLRVPNIYVNNNKVSSHIKMCDIKKIIDAIQVPKIEIRTRKHN